MILDRRPRFDFVTDPPTRVGELARALGVRMTDLLPAGETTTGSLPAGPPPPPGSPQRDLSRHVAGLFVSFQFDFYHERPIAQADRLRERQLKTYTAYFKSGRSSCEALLRTQYGEPQDVEMPGHIRSYPQRRYGPFYVDARDDERVALMWHAVEPDWAKPPADAEAQRRVVAAIVAAQTGAELDAALSALPDGIWRVAAGVAFDPPMAARDVAAALGVGEVIAGSTDVHLSVWRLALRTGDRAEPLRAGAWELEIPVELPAGDAVPGMAAGPVAYRYLAPGDVVRRIHITAPRAA